MERMRVDRAERGHVFRLQSEVLTLRRAEPADRDAVLAMYWRCSAETLRRRYLGVLPDDLAQVADDAVSSRSGVATAAFTPAGSCVAVAELSTIDDPQRVALTVLVEDGWQRYGVGLRLSQVTLAFPERQGRSVWLVSQPDDRAALTLARRLGYLGAPMVDGDGFRIMEIDDDALALRIA